jgi:sugar-specific transcriptional regulator TrmB
MFDPSIVVQTLRELGITRTEAEVYLATLLESGGGAVSGYKVAQSVGKDPANLSKTLASLEKLGAVRTIQEKPRLYLPIPPAEFTDKLIADMKSNRLRILDQLADLETSAPSGIPMALNSREHTIQKAAQILTRCRNECLLFAAREVLETLGTSLEALVASSEVTVRLLCLEDFDWPGVEQKRIDLPVGFSDPQPIPWLQLVVDRKTWLVASFPNAGADKSPCGWWSEDPSVSLVMGAGLAAAMESSVQVSLEIPAVESLPVEPEMDLDNIEETADPELEMLDKLKTRQQDKEPETKPEPREETEDEDDGIQFIMKHDEEEDGPKPV